MKGLAGWTPSAVAASSWEDSGQPEDNPHTHTEEHHLDEVLQGKVDIPLSDQAVVDKEADDWATLWQETHEYTPPQFGYEPSALYPMIENDIRAAALSFPPNTGHGADGLAPRAIARLSSQALQALIALFLAFEASGSWCQAVNMVLIVLLPKPDGGRRPIGLFPTIVRIWMRARIGTAR